MQHTVSLISSLDVLLNAFIANAVVLCALLQDKGYKKTKYKPPIALALAKTNTKPRPRRNEAWDSDEELIAGGGPMAGSRGASKVAVGAGLDSPGAIEMIPMPSARFQSIRVKQTWEVEVEEVGEPSRKASK